MGYVKHHTIVVTSWNDELIRKAHEQAKALSLAVSDLVASPVNGHTSFFAAPDGSNEGWGASDVGDASRTAFVQWMNDHRHDDGSSSLAWFEASFGSDDWGASIERHAWQREGLEE